MPIKTWAKKNGKAYYLYSDWSFGDIYEARRTIKDFKQHGLWADAVIRKHGSDYNIYYIDTERAERDCREQGGMYRNGKCVAHR
jgi:hypothetical protein